MKITEEVLIDQLTEGHLDSQGGYPFDFQWVNGSLVIAEIDHDDASKLSVYTQQQVDNWIADANEYMEKYKCDVWEAIGENDPTGWVIPTDEQVVENNSENPVQNS